MAYFQCMNIGGGTGDVADVEVNGTSVVDPTTKIAEIDIPTTDIQTVMDEFETYNGGLLSECKVALSPNQDLHGYAEPWVGGAGKNKLPLVLADIKANNTSGTWNGNVYTKDGIDFTILTDDADNVLGITANGIPTNQVGITLASSKPIPAGSYILNGTASGSGWTTSWVNVRVNSTNYNDIGSGASFTVSEASTMTAYCYIASGATISNKTFYPMIRLATESDPTFAPYSNIRPISGHTEVDLQVDGKNLLNPTNAFGSFSGYTINTDGSVTVTEADGRTWDNIAPIPLKAGTYTLSRDVTVGRTAVRTSDNNYGIDIIIFEGRTSISFTLAQDGGIKVKANYSGTYPITIKFQLEQGNQATSYEPYLGHLYQVQIGSTVYGGYVDLVSGVMAVTHVIVTYDGSEDWYWASGDPNAWFFTSKTDMTNGREKDLISNRFKQGYWTDENSLWRAYQQIHVKPDSSVAPSGQSATGLSEFKTWLGSNNLQVVYPLATPQTIQLTPTMVKALVGENHLSAPLDGQEITESKYRELFTWDEVEEIAQKMATSAVANLRCYQSQDGAYGILAYVDSGTVFYDWVAASPSVKLLSTISVMPPLDEIEFTDSSIYSSSICELIVVGDSDVPVVTHVKVTSGKVVFTLSEALDSTIRCACKVTNSILY